MRVPEDKFDIEALEGISREFIIENQFDILEWVQDINWPVAKKITTLLTLHVNDIEDGILAVLKGNDYEWKFNVISRILYSSVETPSFEILNCIKSIYNNVDELEDIKQECQDVLEKFKV